MARPTSGRLAPVDPRLGLGDAGQPAAGVLVGYALARLALSGQTTAQRPRALPLILPPVVTGYLPPDRGWGGAATGAVPRSSGFRIRPVRRWTGAAVAAAIMAFPLMVVRSGWR